MLGMGVVVVTVVKRTRNYNIMRKLFQFSFRNFLLLSNKKRGRSVVAADGKKLRRKKTVRVKRTR